MRKLPFLAKLGLLTLLLLAPQPAAAQSSDAYFVIDLVNQLRAEYGLPPYQVDPTLMAAAQAHSEWAAVLGSHSHTGAGSSTPKDRAIAAGYGGGQTVRVSENIYFGTLATPESALEWWRNSPIHFNGMTSTRYESIGAGVAYSEFGGFFTLKFGAFVGAAPSEAPAVVEDDSPSPGLAPIPVEPVELAKPNEDGSVVHTVQYGQTLWDIAASYDVELSEILALNRLNEESFIQPEDEIVVVASPIQAQQLEEGPIVHTVATGQTLFEIALTYGVDLETVLTLNGLAENAIIHPGDELLIRPGPDGENPLVRPPLFHSVEAGQTPLEIALTYGIDLETLLALNDLNENSLIKPGDQLLIRPGDPTPAPESSPTPVPRVTPVAETSANMVPLDEGAGNIAADAVTIASQTSSRPGSRTLLIGLVTVVGLIGVVSVTAGLLMRREAETDESGP